MADWGGAQWLVVIFMAVRAFLHALRLAGYVEFKPFKKGPPVPEWFGARLADATTILVLWWGGFF